MTVLNTKAFFGRFSTAVAAAAAAVQSRMANISATNEPMSPEQAMQFNYDMSTYNFLTQTTVTVHKDIMDTLKSILAKL